tara:strand:+ start:377 stop:1396 length:1020 start_codon:yes stop_codon:yes gene_type:complete
MSGKGSRYVAITRQEFEQFLKSIRKPFSLKSGTKGVYIIQLSDNVGLAVNSTIGDEVRGLGKASIKLNFVSLHSQKFHKVIYGYKKIMARVVKKKYLQRSTNWRNTLKDAIDKCIAYYNQGSSWFEKIAIPDDMQQPQNTPQVSQDTLDELLKRIETIPNWDKNKFLKSLHTRVNGGNSLTERQLFFLKKNEDDLTSSQPSNRPAPKTNLDIMRDLYVTLRSGGASKEDLEELAEIGKSLKTRGFIETDDMETLSEICADYSVSVPRFNFGKRASKGNWNKVSVGNKVSEVYYRGIPTGSIQKVANGYEAFFNDFGRQKSVGVFRTEEQAFKKIQMEKR